MPELYDIYLRKSRADRDAEANGGGDTLLRHRTTLLELARKMDLTIYHIFEEVVSGETIANRPEMQKLLAEVETGQIAPACWSWRWSVWPAATPGTRAS